MRWFNLLIGMCWVANAAQVGWLWWESKPLNGVMTLAVMAGLLLCALDSFLQAAKTRRSGGPSLVS